MKDATTTHQRTGNKNLRQQRQKKSAHGHKADDHEEEQTWQQVM